MAARLILANTEHYYTPVDLDDDYNILKSRNEERARLPLGSLPRRAIVGLPSRITAFVKDSYMQEQSDVPDADDSPIVTSSSFRNRRKARNGKATSAGSPAVEVYQSITCTQGIATQSFEELRLECYRQSMVATGRPPQPVHQRIVIPPAFAPFHVQESAGKFKDVVMSAEPLLASAFTFSTLEAESVVLQVDETSNAMVA